MKKIPTLFERVFDGNKITEILPNITEGCEEAFLHGEATLKFDGSCCAIINGEFYKRYDAKNGKPVPEGAIKCQNEPDPITGHLPCWVKCNRNNPADKWFWSAYETSIFILKENLPDFIVNSLQLSDGTYEAIGKHFNGNPYNFDFDILVIHGKCKREVERTFEGVKKYLAENNHEGIVFWLNDKPVCKIKRSDFGFEWNGK
ncbi:MAG: hypothetical protein K2G63_01420 [Oscillospiraceae bacterium]|nr:hypothetical protein [Oscillospiraceae bacterium]